MKLQELVSHHAGALNETDLAVWRYIESHPQECCYISIYDLANRCHVSRTSGVCQEFCVNRFNKQHRIAA